MCSLHVYVHWTVTESCAAEVIFSLSCFLKCKVGLLSHGLAMVRSLHVWICQLQSREKDYYYVTLACYMSLSCLVSCLAMCFEGISHGANVFVKVTEAPFYDLQWTVNETSVRCQLRLHKIQSPEILMSFCKLEESLYISIGSWNVNHHHLLRLHWCWLLVNQCCSSKASPCHQDSCVHCCRITGQTGQKWNRRWSTMHRICSRCKACGGGKRGAIQCWEKGDFFNLATTKCIR